MKRSRALASLSRDHHHALVIARELLRSDGTSAPASAHHYAEFLRCHEAHHFALEESVLLPALPPSDRSLELARQVLEDHRYLLEAARRLESDPEVAKLDFVHEVGRRFRDHVQLEERQLFPYLEAALDSAHLEDLGARLNAR